MGVLLSRGQKMRLGGGGGGGGHLGPHESWPDEPSQLADVLLLDGHEGDWTMCLFLSYLNRSAPLQLD